MRLSYGSIVLSIGPLHCHHSATEDQLVRDPPSEAVPLSRPLRIWRDGARYDSRRPGMGCCLLLQPTFKSSLKSGPGQMCKY